MRARQGIIGLVVMQMRDRQRSAAEMQRERGDARKNPEPPRGPLFDVEIRHIMAAIAHSARRSQPLKNKPDVALS